MEGSYDYSADVAFQWPFGYGKSYNTYYYNNLRCTPSEFTVNDTLTISVDVRNAGDMNGKQSVLLFSSDLVASQTPEIRRLRDFTKIELKAGEQKTVTFSLPAKNLSFVNSQGNWVFEPGEFTLQVEDQTIKVRGK
jgi:beta-glucosidase